jgi:hypothetical protein
MRRQKWHLGTMGGGCGEVGIRKWWWWGAWFANPKAEEGVGAKNPKPSVCGSVSGVLCKTAVWGNAGTCWVQVNGMEVVRGVHICQCEAGAGFGPKTQNQVFIAQFQVCHAKWRCWDMVGAGQWHGSSRGASH